MLVNGSPNVQLFEFLNEFKSELSTKDLGQVHYFLGIKIVHNSNGLRNNLLFYVPVLKLEYRIAQTAHKINWLSYLFNDLGIPLLVAPKICCDNLSALNLIVNVVLHSGSKHAQIDYHFIRERVALKCFETL